MRFLHICRSLTGFLRLLHDSNRLGDHEVSTCIITINNHINAYPVQEVIQPWIRKPTNIHSAGNTDGNSTSEPSLNNIHSSRAHLPGDVQGPAGDVVGPAGGVTLIGRQARPTSAATVAGVTIYGASGDQPLIKNCVSALMLTFTIFTCVLGGKGRADWDVSGSCLKCIKWK